MKKVLAGIAAAAALMASSAAGAASYTYDLNRVLAALTPTSGWGTVTISDSSVNSNWVDVSIELNSTYKPLSLYLNYAGCSSLTLYTSPSFTSGADASVDCNSEKAGGYGDSNGTFDISIPDSGNLGNVNDISFTMYRSSGNLDASSFNTLDQWGNLYVALHVGNLADGRSIWLGSDGTTTRVPEPAMLGLLGLGMFGLAAFRRRRS
ncbi:MAG: PEP-CTERM sorting domain-containing protein [Burkholderiaceae bacterium]